MGKNQELERINERIEQLFKEWKSLQPLKTGDQKRFDDKARLEWNYNSNHIEGNTLTYNETEVLLREGKEEGIHPARDYKEMKAHDLAINKIKEFARGKERKLNETTIRELNQIILKEPFWNEAKKKIIPGQYKKQPNHVRTEIGIFKFEEPRDVPIKMQELMAWFHNEMENPTLSISSFLAELHHRFILIHPFDDGNGRITRLWINYVLLYFGYPPLVIKSEDKRNYFAALQRADHSDLDALAIYLGKALIFWLELGIRAAKGEDINEIGDVDKEVDLFIREQESKGLHKYFSKESAINLIDNLSDTLFEPFKNNFKSFDKLFYSTNIEQIIERLSIDKNKINSPQAKLVQEKFRDKEDIKNQLKLLDDDPLQFNFIKIYIKLLYEKHLNKHFDIETSLVIEIKDFKYNINIISYARYKNNIELNPYKSNKIIFKKENKIEERFYDQIFKQEEVSRFILQGKKEFIELLKTLTDENNG